MSTAEHLKPERRACSTVSCTLVRSHVDTPRTGIARPSDRGSGGRWEAVRAPYEGLAARVGQVLVPQVPHRPAHIMTPGRINVG